MCDCPICKSHAQELSSTMESRIIRCVACRTFSIDGMAEFMLNENKTYIMSDDIIHQQIDINKRQRAIASSILHNFYPYTSQDNIFKITKGTLNELILHKDKQPLEKLDLILLEIWKKTESIGRPVRLDLEKECPELTAKVWALDLEECIGMLTLLTSSEYIIYKNAIIPNMSTKTPITIFDIEITPKGFKRIEELQHSYGNGNQAFVAMSFADEMDSIYIDAIKPAIDMAGYDALRVDKSQHADKIDDKIIMEIRRSRFVVADFSGHRGGVYFEAGFAKGLALPVIWTCEKKDMKALHFDTRQYNHIEWERGNLAGFTTALHERIEAILGHGKNTRA